MVAAPKKKRRSEDSLRLIAGAVAITLVIGFLAGTVFIQGRHFGPGITITMEVGRIGKLDIGTAVRVSSKKIGQVERITFAPRGVSICPPEIGPFAEAVVIGKEDAAPRLWLTLWIKRGERKNLLSNAEFFVNQGGILAPQYIEVLPPPRDVEPGALLKAGDKVCGVTPPPTDRLLTRSLENMKILRAVIDEQKPAITRLVIAGVSLWATLQSVQSDPGQLTRVVAHARLAFEEGEGLLDDLGLDTSAPRLRKVAARFRILVRSLEGDIASMRTQVNQLDANITRLGNLIPPARRRAVRAALASFRITLTEGKRILAVTGRITQAIADAEGNIGLMLADRELFDDFKTMGRIMKERPFNATGVPPAVVDEP